MSRTENNLSAALQRVDTQESAADAIGDVFSVIEETTNYMAMRLRGMSTATRERRKLREEIEQAVKRFIEATNDPGKAAVYAHPGNIVQLICLQSPAAIGAAAAAQASHETEVESSG